MTIRMTIPSNTTATFQKRDGSELKIISSDETVALIAAAPDLLETLEAVNQHLCYGISDTIDALKDISSSAIARAKGEV